MRRIGAVPGNQLETGRYGGCGRDAAGYQPESRDDMSRHEVLGVRRVRKDRRTEDEREDCDRVGHDRQEVFGESRVGSDDLPDDRHCGRVQGQTDRAEKKDDRTCDHARGIVAPEIDEASVKEAK